MFQDSLPALTEVVTYDLHAGETKKCASSQMELSPCYLLTVRIIRMKNLRRADALSNSDCYVSLWLPTATCKKIQTKTVNDCKNPVWNETFYFRIQSRIKNVLELSVYDEDVVTPDDHLFTVRFDVAKLPLGERVLKYFKTDPKAQEELEVEFTLETISGPPEAIITNGIIVSRALCCLEVEVNEKKTHRSRKDLSLTVKDSHEGTQDLILGPNAIISSSYPTKFHYIKHMEPTLNVVLPKKKYYHARTCRYITHTDAPVVMLNALPTGERVTVTESQLRDCIWELRDFPLFIEFDSLDNSVGAGGNWLVQLRSQHEKGFLTLDTAATAQYHVVFIGKYHTATAILTYLSESNDQGPLPIAPGDGNPSGLPNKNEYYRSHCSCPEDLDVRLGYDLCAEEKDFLCKRKKYVAAALKNVLQLEEDLQDHEIPVVAIMTTGGGMRSFTTTYGSLLGLKKLNVLDCATYLSGLSGTTWTMTNLYEDAYWSQKDLDEKIREAQKSVTKCKSDCFSMERLKYFNQQLCQRKQEGYRTSFIDLWGLIIEYMLHDGKNNHKLSDQREALCEGQNPLPIYVAISVRNNYSTLDFKEWVEFTPYEVGFPKYGAFVRVEDLGSEFFMGRLLKRLPETRISYLHGMWSSIFSLNLLYIWSLTNSSEDFWHRWTREKVVDIEEEPVLPTRPHELHTRMYTPAGPFSTALREALTDRLSVAQYHNFLKGFQLHNDYLGNENFCKWKATVLDMSPNQLSQQPDLLSMIDTGFFINTSCIPLLRPERKVDVILHLSYSSGSQTLPLEQTCKYYEEQKIPFPKVFLSEEDKKNLKECYLFQDSETPGSPIVLFFPLVNDTFQHYKAPGVRRCHSEMEECKVDVTSCSSPYNTYSVTYTDEDYHRLVNLSEYNILNNAHLILQALHMAVERKRQCKK